MEGETRSNPGPHLRMFLTCRSQAASGASLLAGLRRAGEGLLECTHVLGLQEQTEGRVDLRLPCVRGHDAVVEGSCELVRLPLLESPLQVRPVELRVRV